MSGWTLRKLITHKEHHGIVYTSIGIHEIYKTPDGYMYTEKPVDLILDSEEELNIYTEECFKCLSKPTLDVNNIDNWDLEEFKERCRGKTEKNFNPDNQRDLD